MAIEYTPRSVEGEKADETGNIVLTEINNRLTELEQNTPPEPQPQPAFIDYAPELDKAFILAVNKKPAIKAELTMWYIMGLASPNFAKKIYASGLRALSLSSVSELIGSIIIFELLYYFSRDTLPSTIDENFNFLLDNIATTDETSNDCAYLAAIQFALTRKVFNYQHIFRYATLDVGDSPAWSFPFASNSSDITYNANQITFDINDVPSFDIVNFYNSNQMSLQIYSMPSLPIFTIIEEAKGEVLEEEEEEEESVLLTGSYEEPVGYEKYTELSEEKVKIKNTIGGENSCLYARRVKETIPLNDENIEVKFSHLSKLEEQIELPPGFELSDVQLFAYKYDDVLGVYVNTNTHIIEEEGEYIFAHTVAENTRLPYIVEETDNAFTKAMKEFNNSLIGRLGIVKLTVAIPAQQQILLGKKNEFITPIIISKVIVTNN